ncbi:hypothetical protein [bacterium endosymbiont of Bathymodiolus sp. 5 South]|jgi:hypothetical protein|uniref:hypothetical protein n=1 Tax=bacterium endosymbiont of Bathymodiolus sp. 5 South TaxID=1181670 RepID=UPI0010B232B0|nr:hypothetical protein [bacterium endosymbiont of Bathymodiolus sp. 5 South]CAC9655027.1 hypothetical protein [uncultured Gammaproteobacteria bacterium]SHN92033.1 hypothetical protein BCLUESOX_2255 [bacterium endosymbiont of Bathymodiolus sp. 5 South]VVH58693.1 hypothetical protein BSPCLSOX_2593 [uncultured Gammaproteobacteria bacterium]VVH63414.1 hypothetical protein BSPWISOX_382 [uncultured Gammaproteobacteria bacterium]VVM20397.1 hypothetical protein BSPWISOXPB_9087 [uncultured Gammaproteo
MKITKERVLSTINYIKQNPNFYFPFKIMCLDFDEHHEMYEEDCLDFEYHEIKNDNLMVNFILVENLQNLLLETVELMSKGFFEKIEYMDALSEVSNLAQESRGRWKKELRKSEDIEIYGMNEFVSGKAEAYENCVRIIQQKSFNI